MQTVRLSASARRVLALVLVTAAGRLVLAWVIGLGVDESYEVVMARTPALSYFDHPPLSFWIAGAMARSFGTESRLAMRLPFILLFAATTAILFGLTARLYDERAGWWAALLLNLSPVFSLSTGGWVLPDGPLELGMVAGAYCLTRALFGDALHARRWWIGAGVAGGVALLSKYHGVFLFGGTLLFLVTQREARPWLRRPEPYLGAAIALALASPVMIWNAQHHFASLRFQAGRASAHGLHFPALAQSVGGQLGYLLPWIAVPLLWQIWRGLRVGPRDAPRWLLSCLAVCPIALFTLLSLGGNPGLPHWPAPGYLMLFPLAGDAAARYEHRGAVERMLIRRLAVAAVFAFVLLTAVAASAIATGWPARVAPSLFRHGDPTVEAVDWNDLGSGLERIGALRPGVLVATMRWIDAAKAGYALGPSYDVICVGDDPRGFLFTAPTVDRASRDVLILGTSGRERLEGEIRSHFPAGFQSIESLGVVPITRGGRTVVEVTALRAH